MLVLACRSGVAAVIVAGLIYSYRGAAELSGQHPCQRKMRAVIMTLCPKQGVCTSMIPAAIRRSTRLCRYRWLMMLMVLDQACKLRRGANKHQARQSFTLADPARLVCRTTLHLGWCTTSGGSPTLAPAKVLAGEHQAH